MQLSFIGLGNMGLPMLENLLKAGHQVTVYNRTYKEVAPSFQNQVNYASKPKEAAQQSDFIITMLSDDEAIEQVVTGENGILAGLPHDGIHLSASTISVDMAKKLTELHQQNAQHFLSATVLGRPDAAQAAKISVLLAGTKKARERALPFLEAVSQEIFIIGDRAEAGNTVKLGVNFLIASMLEALAESQLLVEKYDVDPGTFMDIVNSLFQSPVYQNYGAMMVNKQFDPAGFKMSLGRKDVQLALNAANAVDSPLPLAELIQQHFSKGVEQGYGDLDWTALIKCLEDTQK
ncbi:NAD(P)-dependent oxidoreductase [Gracilibacillus sp. S3-1-1]|uniref:NAD(P)-dependent oxidoreductase n=1 Tax=Gracilibacillus pellucidus TaxID=3095368 RepID=A0ACC6M281_9BACI|nr:NAD(P)-dependent oxidoreductase [Gracilibacillus sp. S3-1-1]MDX8044990.1 NAD(P)-dependent oxidoreductase [Gracilibacillus sp. S3-1-1]